jgi:hypothetical protein
MCTASLKIGKNIEYRLGSIGMVDLYSAAV